MIVIVGWKEMMRYLLCAFEGPVAASAVLVLPACLPACLQVLQALPSLKAHAEGLHRYDGLAIIRPGAPEGISSAEAASVGPLRRAAETAAGGARDLPGPGRSGGPEGLL